jgi:hypothetical protein
LVEPDVEQFEPAATHEPLTQQPSPSQVLPSQHGSPGAPHDLQVLPEHERPPPVQKLAAERLLEPWQQDCPSPPQLPQPPNALDEHVPVSVPPQAAPGSTHFPPAQHDAPLHSWCPQHGWPVPPQL